MFTSSELCRANLRRQLPSVPVIVCNKAGSALPINLAAALCADTPERDVYLIEDNPSKSLALRARAAGIRGILDRAQADRLLAIAPTPRAVVAPVIPTVSPAPVIPVAPVAAASTVAPVLPAPVSAASPVADIPPVASPVAEPPFKQGLQVGFFSGRGGVGKSTVALMTAFAAQRRGLRVALVDLDLQFGDLKYLAGKEPAACVQQFSLAQLCECLELPSIPHESLALVLAPDAPEQGERFASTLPVLLTKLALQRDLVVINTGSFWTDVHARVAQQCDQLVFLMDQRATSIEACKQAVDLCLRLHVPQMRFRYLLNGCGRHAALMPMDVSLALGGVEVCALADGGTLVDELLALGCPLELLESKNAFVASLEDFLDTLMGQRLKEFSAARDEGGRAEAQRGTRRSAKLLNFPLLRTLFEGARRVTP
jgi:pilus assembly protein CpaE